MLLSAAEDSRKEFLAKTTPICTHVEGPAKVACQEQWEDLWFELKVVELMIENAMDKRVR